jgi:hypothetical protein
VVAGGIHPADERDGLIDVGVAEFVAMMSAHVGKELKIFLTADERSWTLIRERFTGLCGG